MRTAADNLDILHIAKQLILYLVMKVGTNSLVLLFVDIFVFLFML